MAERRASHTDIAEGGPVAIDPKLARALANPLRARVLGELHLRPMSPSRFVAEVGGEITAVSRAFRQLRDAGLIELVERRHEGGRRGAAENIFRAIERDYYDNAAWAELPRFVREDLTDNTVDFFFRRIAEAIGTGNFDRELDRHFSWSAPAVDRQGWKEITERLDALLDWLPEVEAASVERMRESDEAPIPMTVGLAGFRSPSPSELSVYRAREKADE